MAIQKTAQAVKFVLSMIEDMYVDFQAGEYWLVAPDNQHDLELGYCTTIHDLADVLFEVHLACTGPDHTLDGWTLYADGEE
jgi:hypothetical protein